MAFICRDCDWVDPSSVLPSHCPGCGGKMIDPEAEISQDEMGTLSFEKEPIVGIATTLCGKPELSKKTAIETGG